MWSLVTPVLDAATASRIRPCTAADQPAYFAEHLTPQQARFMEQVLLTRAKPGSYPGGEFAAAFASRTPFRLDLTRCHEIAACRGASPAAAEPSLHAKATCARTAASPARSPNPEDAEAEIVAVLRRSVWSPLTKCLGVPSR